MEIILKYNSSSFLLYRLVLLRMRVEYNINEVQHTSYPLVQYGLFDVHSPVAPGLTESGKKPPAHAKTCPYFDELDRPYIRVKSHAKKYLYVHIRLNQGRGAGHIRAIKK
jgi:hypothetical protein